jgi:putative restriction endonuclease
LNAVFTYRSDSPYDDEPGERYHFPGQYKSRVDQTVGDWILFHELKASGGANAYVSFARVDRIDIDPARPGFYYARLSQAGTFGVPVPVDPAGGPLESMIRAESGGVKPGVVANAVRILPRDEFESIVALASSMPLPKAEDVAGLAEEQAPFATRPIVEALRAKREVWFRQRVLDAYDRTCALSGMRLINGGGASEVEAAHIRPVAEGGSDLLQNGLALTRTVHWMFDRSLVTFDDDLRLVRTPLLSDEASRFLGNVTQLRVPAKVVDRPNISFIRFHRERTFAKVRATLAGR